jgi:hypothetical protein
MVIGPKHVGALELRHPRCVCTNTLGYKEVKTQLGVLLTPL